MSRNIVWLAGRGVSMSCGLCWDLPPHLERAFRRGELAPEALVERVCAELERAQRAGSVDTRPLRTLLRALRAGGAARARHSFVTTNWDTLLDRVLEEEGFPAPAHLNGSIAEGDLLFGDDSERRREAAPQAREGLRRLREAGLCVLAGLSLASRLDKALLERLADRQGATWLVVNHDRGEVERACELVRARLPGSSVVAVEEPFDRWIEAGMPQLGRA